MAAEDPDWKGNEVKVTFQKSRLVEKERTEGRKKWVFCGLINRFLTPLDIPSTTDHCSKIELECRRSRNISYSRIIFNFNCNATIPRTAILFNYKLYFYKYILWILGKDLAKDGLRIAAKIILHWSLSHCIERDDVQGGVDGRHRLVEIRRFWWKMVHLWLLDYDSKIPH